MAVRHHAGGEHVAALVDQPLAIPEQQAQPLLAAVEELRVERVVLGQAGIVERTLSNSASYIAGWLERLRDDQKLVVIAAAQAQRAADFILNARQEASEESGVSL